MDKQLSLGSNPILKDCARFFVNVFQEFDKYCPRFQKMLLSGGGGNSMFCNAWVHPSSHFNKRRISKKLEKELKKKGYTIEEMLSDKNKILRNNAKGASKRKVKGKFAHEDHNPGNVKILHELKDLIQKNKQLDKDKLISIVEKYMENAQTIDYITVEEDDIRTYGDNEYTKDEKNMMSKEERDDLIGGSGNFKFI
jgi:CRISPR/Cas system-associated protein endoribonuclease Cas2